MKNQFVLFFHLNSILLRRPAGIVRIPQISPKTFNFSLSETREAPTETTPFFETDDNNMDVCARRVTLIYLSKCYLDSMLIYCNDGVRMRARREKCSYLFNSSHTMIINDMFLTDSMAALTMSWNRTATNVPNMKKATPTNRRTAAK